MPPSVLHRNWKCFLFRHLWTRRIDPFPFEGGSSVGGMFAQGAVKYQRFSKWGLDGKDVWEPQLHQAPYLLTWGLYYTVTRSQNDSDAVMQITGLSNFLYWEVEEKEGLEISRASFLHPGKRFLVARNLYESVRFKKKRYASARRFYSWRQCAHALLKI